MIALHYGVVAIEKWDMTKYAQDYPRACSLHKYVDTPVKVKKFLVGRQFFVIFVVFLIAQITSFPHIPKSKYIAASVCFVLLLKCVCWYEYFINYFSNRLWRYARNTSNYTGTNWITWVSSIIAFSLMINN